MHRTGIRANWNLEVVTVEEEREGKKNGIERDEARIKASVKRNWRERAEPDDYRQRGW